MDWKGCGRKRPLPNLGFSSLPGGTDETQEKLLCLPFLSTIRRVGETCRCVGSLDNPVPNFGNEKNYNFPGAVSPIGTFLFSSFFIYDTPLFNTLDPL
jgi:hypothetical protein